MVNKNELVDVLLDGAAELYAQFCHPLILLPAEGEKPQVRLEWISEDAKNLCELMLKLRNELIDNTRLTKNI